MGVYSAVEKFPKYGPQWKKRSAKKAEAPAEQPAAQEQPAVQEPPAAQEQPAVQEQPAAQETIAEKKEEPQNEASTQLA
jgi:intermembrane space import and assembly protein 40